MTSKAFFKLSSTLLFGAGLWGAWLIGGQQITSAYQTISSKLSAPIDGQQPNLELTPSPKNVDTFSTNSVSDSEQNQPANAIVERIIALITSNQTGPATEQINLRYSEFSSEQLQHFKNAFLQQSLSLRRAGDYSSAQSVMIDATAALDEIELWSQLARLSAQLMDWPTALDAQLKVANLEIDPQRLAKTLDSLIAYAQQHQTQLAQIGDELGINALYQRLHNAYPSRPHFQLKLAQSYQRLNDQAQAVTNYEQIQYDAELGGIARQALAQIKSQQRGSRQPSTTAVTQKPNNRASDIVVPLKRIGNSFILNTAINGRSLPLLLDTGASITALSRDQIARLNLQPTGQRIQLTTANGITQANLYKADKISLGTLTIKNLIVAEIDLGSNSGFQGLLGTDLLNSTPYSYLIDNQQNALIFRSRR